MAESGSGSETQMRDTELFQAALGLGTPWLVSGSRFDAAARRVMHRTQVKGEAPPAA